MPQTCKYVSLYGKKDLSDVIKDNKGTRVPSSERDIRMKAEIRDKKKGYAVNFGDGGRDNESSNAGRF